MLLPRGSARRRRCASPDRRRAPNRNPWRWGPRVGPACRTRYRRRWPLPGHPGGARRRSTHPGGNRGLADAAFAEHPDLVAAPQQERILASSSAKCRSSGDCPKFSSPKVLLYSTFRHPLAGESCGSVRARWAESSRRRSSWPARGRRAGSPHWRGSPAGGAERSPGQPWAGEGGRCGPDCCGNGGA